MKTSAQRVRLKYVCEGGGEYGLNIPASEYVDHGVRLIRTSDLAGGRLATQDSAIFVPAESVSSGDLLQPDDLLLSRSGTVGRAFLVPTEAAGMAYAGFLVRFRTRSDVVPQFLYYCTQSAEFQSSVQAEAITSTIQNFNAERYNNLTIPMVPLHEQRAIADYLDRETARIDILIQEQQTLVSLLAERRVAVITNPFDQAHSTAPLGSVVEELIDHRGKTPGKVGDKADDFTDEGVPVISAIHIKNGEISWGERERFVPYWMFEKWMPVRLRPGDVLLTSEAPLGNVAQVPTDAPLVLSQRLFALRGREKILDSTYLRFFLESDRGQALLRDGASGSTVSGIRQSRLVQVPVPVPPVDEQSRVSQQVREQITKIDTLIAETERFIELSKERRAALITAVVTGQIDVREVG